MDWTRQKGAFVASFCQPLLSQTLLLLFRPQTYEISSVPEDMLFAWRRSLYAEGWFILEAMPLGCHNECLSFPLPLYNTDVRALKLRLPIISSIWAKLIWLGFRIQPTMHYLDLGKVSTQASISEIPIHLWREMPIFAEGKTPILRAFFNLKEWTKVWTITLFHLCGLFGFHTSVFRNTPKYSYCMWMPHSCTQHLIVYARRRRSRVWLLGHFWLELACSPCTWVGFLLL